MTSKTSQIRPAVARLCGLVAAAVGLAIIYFYVAPDVQAGPAPEASGLLIYMAAAGLLSIFAAIGYLLSKRWGWYVHLVSTLAQLAFPGFLFELKPDPYHLVAWACPVVSLAVVIIMRGAFRRAKEEPFAAAPPPQTEEVFSSPLDPLSPISREEKRR